MPSLQIRELPDPIYIKLKEQAKREARSLSQQAVVTLAKGLGIGEKDLKERRKEIIEKISRDRIISTADDLPDPAELIRQDRER